MRTWKGLVALTALAPLAIAASPLAAQEAQPSEAMPACSATVKPAQVRAGLKAERVAVTLSSAIGAVSEFSTEQAEAGVKLAEQADLPRTEMANEAQAQKPIEMANEGNQVTIWLNTEAAEPGTYHFTLQGDSGKCEGSVEITKMQ
jgi:hypothetical protein